MKQGRPTPPKLLISVRSAEEAAAALEAGADLIDVKDPNKGPLGMAEAEVVAAVVAVVGGRVPVSAAFGEWHPAILTEAHWHLQLPLDYIKWGLAGYPHTPGWGEDLLDTRRQVKGTTEVVAVAYADYARAKSVPPAEVAKFAKRFRFRAFLLDTFTKDTKSVFDHFKLDELSELMTTLRNGGVPIALGGSLKFEQIKQIKALAPDWVAVRGGVCVGGKRDAELDPVRVKKWKEALA